MRLIAQLHRGCSRAAAHLKGTHTALETLKSKRTLHIRTDVDGDEDDEQDALVRSLVQDAFRPPQSPLPDVFFSGVGAANIKQEERQRQPAHAAQRPTNATPEGDDTSHFAYDRSTLRATVTPTDPMLYVRAANAAYEPFIRVRRQAYTHTVNERKELTSSDDAVEWMCTQCHTYNFMKRGTCRHCGAFAIDSHRRKHPPARHVVLFPATWVCTGCGGDNSASVPSVALRAGGSVLNASSASPPPTAAAAARAKFFCQHCARPFSGAADWCCPECHAMNPKAAAQCASCLRDRPTAWTCGACGHTKNNIFLLICRSCSAPRSPVLESDAVVRCPSCATRNDVRWELCEACMAPLPAAMEAMRWQPRDSAAAVDARSTPPPTVKGSISLAPRVGAPVSHASPQQQQHQSAPSLWTNRANTASELEGSWWCSHCNVVQRRNALFCDICLRPRGSAAADSAGKPVRAPGSWQCPTCRQYRPVNERSCCGEEREAPRGYWLCADCCSTSRVERSKCLGCGAAPLARPWKCPVCRTKNSADASTCETCAGASPLVWRCSHCGNVSPVHTNKRGSKGGDGGVCLSCGTAAPPAPTPVTCPVCHAPNASVRRSCFRCRGRLQSDAWRCGACGESVEDRQARRCPSCARPRDFDTREETWVCGVCETAVASGGALPVRSHCPRCGSERTLGVGALAFPSRWRCRACHVFNWTTEPVCVECGERRVLASLHADVHCPHCFRRTLLDREEMCAHCKGSLSDLLTEAGTQVSQGGHGIFGKLHAEAEPSSGTEEAAMEESVADALIHEKPVQARSFVVSSKVFPDDAGGPLAAHLDDEEEELLKIGEDGLPLSLAEDNLSAAAMQDAQNFQTTWTCPRCEASNTDEYLACVCCSCPRSRH